MDSLNIIQLIRQKLTARSARTLILSRGADSARGIQLALERLGFSNIVVSIDSNQCASIYQSENRAFEWIIIADLSNDSELAQSQTELIRELSRAQKTCITYLAASIDTNLEFYLVNGLTTWHHVKSANGEINDVLEELLAHPAASEHSLKTLSDFYRRRYLLHMKDHAKLLEHDHKTIELNHNAPRLLINLAESNYLVGNTPAAITLLVQAKNMDGRLSPEISALYSKIKSEARPSSNIKARPASDGQGENQKICVIIESDSSVRKQMTAGLSSLGISSLVTFDNGAAAWSWLSENPEPSMIITEWKNSGLTGSNLIQRIRIHGLNETAIVVCSSKVPQAELPLFREFSVSHLLKKPFTEREFKIAVSWSIQQHERPTNQLSLEKEIFLAIRRGDWKTAHNLKAAYLANGKIFESRKKLLEAEFLYQQQKYNEAIDTAKAAAKMSEIDSLDLIDLMGRCYDKVGGDAAAQKFFEIAEKMSPNNVKRKCDLIEIYERSGNRVLAEKKITAALALDNGSEFALEAALKHAMSVGDHERVEQILPKIPDRSRVLAHLNNWSVHLTRLNRIEDGIKVYKLILKFLPDDQKEMRVRISYNLALGLIKFGRSEEALQILRTINIEDYPAIKQKRDSLLSKVESALKRGQTLKLDDQKKAPASSPAMEGSVTAIKNLGVNEINEKNIGDVVGELEDISTHKPNGTSKKSVA